MEKLKGRNVDIRIRLSVETLGLTNNTVKNIFFALKQNFVLHRFTFLSIMIKNLVWRRKN